MTDIPDYDDPNDQVPTTAGAAVVDAVTFTGAIEVLEHSKDATIFGWKANSHEQIEARLHQTGWRVERYRPWKGELPLEFKPSLGLQRLMDDIECYVAGYCDVQQERLALVYLRDQIVEKLKS